MARRRKNINRSTWSKLGSSRQPVNGVAARVVGDGVKKPRHEELLEKAKSTRDRAVRASIMAEAREAKSNYESRLMGKTAENRAKKAMEKAQWLAKEKNC